METDLIVVPLEMTMAVLEATDLHRFYRTRGYEVPALRGVSLVVKAGETVALVGPSGSGKSTLLACLAGIDVPDGGQVCVAGRAMTMSSESERAVIRRQTIGFMAQAGNLFGHLSLAENVELQQRLANTSDDDRTDHILRLVGLAERGDFLPGMLSGGELARGALAVALASDPPLLLADEPTAEIDEATERFILDAIEDRRARGGAALIATHSRALAVRASRVLPIADGKISEPCPKPSKRTNTGQPSAASASCVGVTAGREAESGGALVTAKQVEKLYTEGRRAIRALAPATFEIRSGARIAIMGPSGSGKTTLLSLLAGMEPPSGGQIVWPGLEGGEPRRPTDVSIVVQSASLMPALTAIENVALPRHLTADPLARWLDPRDLLHQFGIADLADRRPDELSGGQAQRVAVARAFVTRPRLLLADEPTGQLDRATGEQLIDDMVRLIDGTPTALIIATHDPAIAARLDRLWLMDKGALALERDGAPS